MEKNLDVFVVVVEYNQTKPQTDFNLLKSNVCIDAKLGVKKTQLHTGRIYFCDSGR